MKTSELAGIALDWAVAKCEGVKLYSGPRDSNPAYKANWVRRKHGDLFQPSTDWAQGGPIIEREKIAIRENGDSDDWYACKRWDNHGKFGPTPLIAAMRVYLASKLGDDIDIPEELQ